MESESLLTKMAPFVRVPGLITSSVRRQKFNSKRPRLDKTDMIKVFSCTRLKF